MTYLMIIILYSIFLRFKSQKTPTKQQKTAHSRFFFFKKTLFIYFIDGKGGRKKGRETSMCGCLLCPLLGTWPATQACALSGNPTGNPLVCRPAFNPLSHTSQGLNAPFFSNLVHNTWSNEFLLLSVFLEYLDSLLQYP